MAKLSQQEYQILRNTKQLYYNHRNPICLIDALSIPEGYEVEISAFSTLCTIAPTNLVPETDNWKIVPDGNISNSTIAATDIKQESDWEIVTSPILSPFVNNIIARDVMGQMARAIGASTSWNHCHF